MSDLPLSDRLPVFACLQRILMVIKASGEKSLTRTHLSRAIDTKGYFDTALDYGCKSGYLNREKQNYISIKNEKFSITEDKYYPATHAAIKQLWESDGYDRSQFYLEETAKKDSKIIGPWTRPDFTLVSHKKFPWTIGQEFDVVTFEVKRPETCNVLAVFEALSHASAATRAYVVFPLDAKKWKKEAPEQERRVKDECTRHGVGLILIENVTDKPSPMHVIKAVRREISHEKCSDFLDAVISTEGKQKISAWK